MDYGRANLSRKVFRPEEEGGDPLWHEARTFSRWEAWEYLFAYSASFAPRIHAGVKLQRGETVPLSIRFLAGRWRWSEKKVRVFLSWLEKDGRIRAQQRTEKGHTYLLVNYGRWNPEGHSKGTGLDELGHKLEERKDTTYSSDESDGGESKKPKPKKTRAEYTPEFEEAWDLYPTRPGDSKREAFRAWSARIREGISPAAMIAGTEQYHRYVAFHRTEPRYIKRAATFYGPNLHFEEAWEYGLKAA